MGKEVAHQPDKRTPIVRLRDTYRTTFLIGIGFFLLAVFLFLIDASSTSYVIGKDDGNAAAFGFGVFAGWVAGLLLLIGGAGWMVTAALIADRNSRHPVKKKNKKKQ